MILCSFNSAGEQPVNYITIVYNNVAGDTSDVQTGLGFSAYIVFKEKTLLFDVGSDCSTLMNNIKVLDLDISKVDAVMISHNHWDHVYGLPEVLFLTEYRSQIYVPSSSREAILQQNPRASIITVDKPIQIFEDIWSTGSLDVYYRNLSFFEQSLILNEKDGLYVVTGCAHPGIVKIIERINQLFPEMSIALLTGGFHLVNATEEEIKRISSALKKLGVKNIAPSHCTGKMAMEIFEQEWGDGYCQLYLGHTLRF